jgi:hypothetical protein
MTERLDWRSAGRESGSLKLAAPAALTARLANLPVNRKKSSSCRLLLFYCTVYIVNMVSF